MVIQLLFSLLFFKQKTAYEMRISDWSSDVALPICWPHQPSVLRVRSPGLEAGLVKPTQPTILFDNRVITKGSRLKPLPQERVAGASPWAWSVRRRPTGGRSEAHTSELQSLMRISYAVFCLTKKTHNLTAHCAIPHN